MSAPFVRGGGEEEAREQAVESVPAGQYVESGTRPYQVP
jgi:hypothetical protein